MSTVDFRSERGSYTLVAEEKSAGMARFLGLASPDDLGAKEKQKKYNSYETYIEQKQCTKNSINY